MENEKYLDTITFWRHKTISDFDVRVFSVTKETLRFCRTDGDADNDSLFWTKKTFLSKFNPII